MTARGIGRNRPGALKVTNDAYDAAWRRKDKGTR